MEYTDAREELLKLFASVPPPQNQGPRHRPGMKKNVTNFNSRCEICNKVTKSKFTVLPLLQSNVYLKCGQPGHKIAGKIIFTHNLFLQIVFCSR